MIEINLVPPQLKKKRKKSFMPAFNIPKEAIIGLVGGLFVLLLLVHVVLQVIIFYKYAANKKYEKEWAEILPQKENVDVVMNELRGFQSKIKAINGITKDKRIHWASKLNAISDNLPREIWLNKIVFDGDALLVQGSAVSKAKNEMISVGSFVSSLKKLESFTDDFKEIDLGSIKRRTIKSVEVVDFLITAKLK